MALRRVTLQPDSPVLACINWRQTKVGCNVTDVDVVLEQDVDPYTNPDTDLNLNGVRRKKPILATAYDDVI